MRFPSPLFPWKPTIALAIERKTCIFLQFRRSQVIEIDLPEALREALERWCVTAVTCFLCESLNPKSDGLKVLTAVGNR